MSSHRAIALFSAGLDSSVATLLAQEQGFEIVFALTFEYGQRAERMECQRAAALASHHGIPHRTLRLPWFREMGRGGQLLESGTSLPQPGLGDLNDPAYSLESARAVWVPNRNGIFIEIAAGFAEGHDARAIIVGFNAEEGATFPDNTPAYQAALNRALAYSTSNHVEIFSPTSAMNKTEIVREALRLGLDLGRVWSCYESRQKMCGVCESCSRLKRALVENEVPLDGKFEDTLLR